MEWTRYIDRAGLNVIACCCGHKKYPMTIIVKNGYGYIWELISNNIIHRTKRLYKKDKQGYYYIPETIKGG